MNCSFDVVNKDARYIRIINNAQSNKAIVINQFELVYNSFQDQYILLKQVQYFHLLIDINYH